MRSRWKHRSKAVDRICSQTPSRKNGSWRRIRKIWNSEAELNISEYYKKRRLLFPANDLSDAHSPMLRFVISAQNRWKKQTYSRRGGKLENRNDENQGRPMPTSDWLVLFWGNPSCSWRQSRPYFRFKPVYAAELERNVYFATTLFTLRMIRWLCNNLKWRR